MQYAAITRRAALALGTSCMIGGAWSQTGTRNLSFIVPQPAGNPTDGMARKLQPLLQKELGQTVVVENLPGAGGALGVQKVLSAPAGSPFLLIASQTEPILTPLALAAAKYSSEQLRPIGLVGRTPYLLAGRPDLPANTLAELVDLARRNKNKPLTHGHIGQGSMIHLLGEQWARKSGIELGQIPYKGVPPVVQDLMGGQIDLTFLPMGGSTPTLVESGKVRVFGVTSAEASRRLPKVMPLSRQASALTDFVYGTWAAVLVPRAMPDGEVQRLHAALAKALENTELRQYTIDSGVEPADPMSLAQLDRFYETETLSHRSLARELGVQPL
jgi:tripartite-type tricarboxylate transporter receptor subunit TctC